MTGAKISGRKTAEAALYVTVAGIIMYSEIQELLHGDLAEEGITDIVLGVSLLTLYFGLQLADRFANSRSFSSDFGLWVLLVLSGGYVLAGVLLIHVISFSGEAVGMILGGGAGITGAIYGIYVTNSEEM